LGLGLTPTGQSRVHVYTGNNAVNGVQTQFNASNFPIALGSSTSSGFPYLGVNTVQKTNSDTQTYAINGFASRLSASGGGFQFGIAPSGTAGADITFTSAMNLTSDGNLLLGCTTGSTVKLRIQDDAGQQIRLQTATNTNRNLSLGYSDTNDFGLINCDESGVNQKNLWYTALTHSFGRNTSAANVFFDASGNALVGGTAARGTTVGAAHLDLFNGTAPAGTLTNGISLYSDSGDLKFMNAAGDAFDVGYRNIPQNSQSAAYTLVLADAGKHIFHPVGDNNARTFTIPANSSVAYPIGTAITFINMAVANVTIAITTDTLTLSPAGTTGSRTLATNGSATCIKITSTSWLISGSGLT
jgi:hypothetical protein